MFPCFQHVFNDMWAINLRDGSFWRQIPQTSDFPLPRIGHTAVAMGNRILIYGGRNFLAGKYTLQVLLEDRGFFVSSTLPSRFSFLVRCYHRLFHFRELVT